MANYTPTEWQAMRAGPPYGAPLPQRGALAPAHGLATQQVQWTTLQPPPNNHPQSTIGEMGDIKALFDRLTDVVAQQRSSRIVTNSYILELEKLINKLRDCIARLLALLQECKANKEELERLRARIEQHPNLNLIRTQLMGTITEMQKSPLEADQFRAQLVELVGEIKRICDDVDNMRRAEFGDGGDDGGRGVGGERKDDGGGGGTGGQKSQSDSPQAVQQTMNSPSGSRVANEVARLEGDIGQMMSGRTVAPVSPEGNGSDLDGNPVRSVQRVSVNRPTNTSLARNTSRRGGWQTPEKLKSLSKSKPIRTLGSIKKRKGKRTKRRKRRKKQTKKKKKNKKRKKKRTRKR